MGESEDLAVFYKIVLFCFVQTARRWESYVADAFADSIQDVCRGVWRLLSPRC